MRKLITTRKVTKEECPWLDKDIEEGSTVYEYFGCTYGCISSGIAVSAVDGVDPFFEIPHDAARAA